MFVLRTSKTHGKGVKPQIVKITSTDVPEFQKGERNNGKEIPTTVKFCPYNLLQQYRSAGLIKINPTEQFFVFRDRSPVKPAQVRRVPKQAIRSLGLDLIYYDFHCLRSGRATDLHDVLGLSIESCKKIGRWKSSAIFTYFHISLYILQGKSQL